MKHIFMKLVPVFLLFGLISSCKNQDWSFPDYKYSTTYFPYQSPVRTLVLGDYELTDNTTDNNLQFSIGVAIGGMYENNQDRKVGYVLDETLARNLYTDKGDTIVALPQSYYTLSPVGTVTVPRGKMRGYIEVQLTDAFLNDPKAHEVHYVIPLKIISAGTDSILQGKTTVTNPDRRIAVNWVIVPKDYTLFGIKYINPYHGKYLHRGKDVLKDAGGTVVDQVVYRTKYIEDNEIWYLKTAGRNQVSLTGMMRMSSGSPGNFNMLLNFDGNGNCTVAAEPGSPFTISGTGKFVKDGDEWGGKKRNLVTLSYIYTAAYTPIPVNPTIVNDTDPSIVYTGSWNTNLDAPNYNGDVHYSSTPGSYFTFNFTSGTIAIYCKVGPAYGTFDVYIDDMTTPIATNVSAVAGALAYRQKLFEKTDLTVGPHTLKCVIKQSINVVFDYLSYTIPQNTLPSVNYTHEVKDTLVIRDRDVRLETFKPVIK